MYISQRDFAAERAYSDRSAAGIRIRVRHTASVAERERWRVEADRARAILREERRERDCREARPGRLARLLTPRRWRSAPC